MLRRLAVAVTDEFSRGLWGSRQFFPSGFPRFVSVGQSPGILRSVVRPNLKLGSPIIASPFNGSLNLFGVGLGATTHTRTPRDRRNLLLLQAFGGAGEDREVNHTRLLVSGWFRSMSWLLAVVVALWVLHTLRMTRLIGKNRRKGKLMDGASDIVAVVHADGSIRCTPFRVRLARRQKKPIVVTLSIDGRMTDITMRVNSSDHHAFFPERFAEFGRASDIGDQKSATLTKDALFLALSSRGKAPLTKSFYPSDLLVPSAEALEKIAGELRLLRKDDPSRDVFKIGFHSDVGGPDARLFLFRPNEKIVVCDVDNTLTKSEIPGMLLSIFVQRGWVRRGAGSFFSSLRKKGYRIVYVSARPPASRPFTEEHFFRQRVGIPVGPILSAGEDSFIGAAAPVRSREKQLVLLDLVECFRFRDRARKNVNVSDVSVPDVIVAGFGDGQSDLQAYRSAGLERIFLWDSDSDSSDSSGSSVSLSFFQRHEDDLDEDEDEGGREEERERKRKRKFESYLDLLVPEEADDLFPALD